MRVPVSTHLSVFSSFVKNTHPSHGHFPPQASKLPNQPPTQITNHTPLFTPTPNPTLPRLLVTYKNLMQSEEQFGIAMVYGSAYYLRGVLDQSTYLAWAQATSMAWYWLNQSIIISPFIPGLLRKAGAPGEIAERLIER